MPFLNTSLHWMADGSLHITVQRKPMQMDYSHKLGETQNCIALEDNSSAWKHSICKWQWVPVISTRTTEERYMAAGLLQSTGVRS